MLVPFLNLLNHYSTEAPAGFRQFAAANGVASPNTCAVRLAYALHQVDKNFFKDVKAPLEWYGLPTRASDLAVVLNRKLFPCTRVTRPLVGGRRGIIFFDTIRGFGGTGHISLWDSDKVVDGGDYFESSPRAYFWQLS